MTEPVYEHIEFCRSAETLWGKLKEGRWDWLGVHPDGRYVLGSPSRKVGRTRATDIRIMRGATRGRHGIRYIDVDGSAGATWCTTEGEAREASEDGIEVAGFSERPHLLKFVLVVLGEDAEEEFVVRNPPTYR
jgi:hypothetical protein